MTQEQLEAQRPSNPTWKALARIASVADDMSKAGSSTDEIFLETTGKVLEEWIEGAMPEIAQLIAASMTTGLFDRSVMKVAAWIGGFGHGCNDVKGIDISTLTGKEKTENMLARMYAGVDMASVNYVAEQRVMRSTLENDDDFLSLLMALYLDGFTVGFVYTKSKSL